MARAERRGFDDRWQALIERGRGRVERAEQTWVQALRELSLARSLEDRACSAHRMQAEAGAQTWRQFADPRMQALALSRLVALKAQWCHAGMQRRMAQQAVDQARAHHARLALQLEGLQRQRDQALDEHVQAARRRAASEQDREWLVRRAWMTRSGA